MRLPRRRRCYVNVALLPLLALFTLPCQQIGAPGFKVISVPCYSIRRLSVCLPPALAVVTCRSAMYSQSQLASDIFVTAT